MWCLRRRLGYANFRLICLVVHSYGIENGQFFPLFAIQILTILIFSFVAFDHVRIPRENLLNKGGDVSPDGKYISTYKDPRQRFGAALGALSSGRVGITSIAATNLRSCLPIAIRYVL